MGIGAGHHRLAGLDRLAQGIQNAALKFPVLCIKLNVAT